MNMSNRRTVLSVIGVFAAIVLVLAGVWFLAVRDTGGGTSMSPGAPGATISPTAPLPGTPSASTATMTVTVYFHRTGATDPTQVVPVRRTVPASPMVATAALNQLL